MKSGRPRCVTCTYRCPRKRERVRNRAHRDRDRDRDPSTTMLCATNNITYPSWCHIIKDACVTGFVLETRHAGPCNAYDTAPLYIGELTVVKKEPNIRNVCHTRVTTKLRWLGEPPRDARICKRSKNMEYCQEFDLDFTDGTGSDPIKRDWQIDFNFDVSKSVICHPSIFQTQRDATRNNLEMI